MFNNLMKLIEVYKRLHLSTSKSLKKNSSKKSSLKFKTSKIIIEITESNTFKQDRERFLKIFKLLIFFISI